MLTDRSRIARSLCSTLAIATALIVGSGMAQAQSFQGNGTFNSGTGGITTSTGTTTVSITSPNAVIDWTTFDIAIGGGPIDFQPTGTTATFQSTADFSVLNRILPTDPSRAIQFNGNVIAQIQGTTTAPGGSVYFYSPGGVIVGSTAVFNVGNLGLTSIAPEVVGGVFEQTGMSGEFVRFNGAVTPGSAVTIQSGAQINVPNNNYVAIVAPMVNNAGTINVNGAAALVSADAATITFNPTGLFDIQVTSGTSSTGNSGNGRTLINTGTITGPAFNGTGAMHRIYAVAVPKNTAITMVIGNGSSLGFNIAGAANIAGNAVILSAGHDIAGGQIVAAPSAGGGSGTVMIDSFNANYTSEVVARATGRALFASDGTVGAGNTSFAANLTAHSATIASLEARSGGSANVTGNLTLDANAFAATPTSSVTAGNAYLDARNGASLTVGGNAVVVATAQGGNATGGNADATADTGGVINVAGVLRVRAEGLGGSGGSGTGGMASVNARAGGDILANQLNLTAEGDGGDDVGAGAGNGRGGNISLIANGTGSTINIANGNSTGTGRELFFSTARGFGGQSNGGGSGVGGSAFGGNVSISATNGATLNGPANVGTRGFVQIFARALAGDANTGASAGGAATGGNINITVDNAIFTSAELLPSSFAQAGSALPTATGTINGGNATGGTRNITVRNGATMTTSFPGGGPGAQGGDGTLSGRGGDASGGTASLLVDNATLNLTGRGLVFSQNQAGSGGIAGNVTAGTAFATVSNGGTISVPDTPGFVEDLLVASNAFGALAGASAGTAQGSVTAGTATLTLQGGTITGAGSIVVQAEAFANSDQYSQGGTYQGGNASVFLQGGSISNPLLMVSANATAAGVGAGLVGTGGSATGGIALVQATANTTNLTGGQILVEALGLGGTLLGTGTAGNGTGGRANIGTNPGTTLSVSGNVILTADGTGGSDTGTGNSGVGGFGTGGLAELGTFMGGTLNLSGSLSANARGLGGATSRSGFTGGVGTGGIAQIYHDTTGSITLASAVNLIATGLGGAGLTAGAAGGAGSGGQARAILYNVGTGSLAVAGNLLADATGTGGSGNGANGGNATGGFARIGGDAAGKTITINGAATLRSDAAGGAASGSGIGGNAVGGSAQVAANNSSVSIAGSPFVSSVAAGGNSQNGRGGSGTGGSSVVVASNGGSIAVPSTSAVTTIDASGRGGSASGTGDGGSGAAGIARVFLNGGAISFGGSLNIVGQAYGGNGVNGGDAISARPFRQPRALIATFNGTISVAGASTLYSTATGGNGRLGGTGGIAFAGGAAVEAQSNNGPSAINLAALTLDASAFGGFGGDGAAGQAGGAGGEAYGGGVSAFGQAGQGRLTVTGQTIANASADGGLGGTGGSGATGAAGGNGGRAIGGSVSFGTVSGPDTPSNIGSANFSLVSGDASAFGGAGGAGGTGTTAGAGGKGGTGFGGSAGILVRGSPATFTDVALTANGTGGTGGSGSVQGNGGDGYAGDGFTIVTQRFLRTERGTLTANNVVISASGVGGTGATAGNSFYSAAQGAESEFFIRQSDVSIGNYSLTTSGNLAPNVTATILSVFDPATGITVANGIPVPTSITITAEPYDLSLLDSTLTITNGFTLTTPGQMRLTLDNSTLNTANLTLSAANFVLPASPPTAFGTFNVSNSLSVTTGLNFLTYANFNLAFNAALMVPGSIQVGDVIVNGTLQAASGTGGTLTAGNVSATSVALQGTAGLTTGAITSPGAVTLRSTMATSTGTINAGSVDAQSQGSLTTQAISASGLVALSSFGPVSSGAIGAAAITVLTAQTFTSGNLTTSGAVDIGSVGNATVGTVQAGTLAKIRSSAGISAGDITSGGSVDANANGQVTVGNVLAGIVNPSTVAGEKFSVAIGSGGGPVTIGNIGAQGYVAVGSGLALTTGSISGKDLLGFVGNGPASFGPINTGTYNPSNGTYTPGGRVLIELGSQFTLGGNIDNFNPELVFAGPVLPSPGSITINGPVSTGTFDASTNLALTTAAISATETIDLFAGGAITTGQLTGGDSVTANAAGALNVAGASAGIVNPSTNPLADYTVGLRSLVSVTAGDLSSRANIGLSSPGTISVGNLSAGAIVLALAGTGLTTGSITASAPTGRVYLANFSMEALGGVITGNFNPAPILAATPVAINGPIAINGAVTTGTIQANTLQSLSISGATLARQVSALVAGTTLTTGNVTVGDRAIFAAGGAIMLGNVDAGITLNTGGLQKIAIGSSNGPVTTGTLSARQDLGIQSGGAITTGNLRGRDVLLLAGGSVTTGGIAAVNGTQPVGQLFIGNFSMANQTSNVFQTFQSPTTGQLPIFNLDPVGVGGSITLGGQVLAGAVAAAATQGFTASAITAANFLRVDAGGLVTVNGRWQSGNLEIVSSDIDIANTGSLDSGALGELSLASRNSSGAFIGDGLSGSGFNLSNAEFAKLTAGDIKIIAFDMTGLATDMTIGNLTITGSQLYSGSVGADGANGIVLFATGNPLTETAGGILRVAGNVSATGFTPTTEIDLISGTVEIEAANGSVKVSAGSDASSTGSPSLGGLIFVEADHIHIASDAILTKLRADPLYTGHIEELNAPATVQRPDGVFNALGFEINVGETFYIQNTGSRIVPAGFLTTFDATDVFGPDTPPTGGVEIVINGQFQTSTGTVTGKAAYDLIAADPTADSEQFFGFSTTSQLNGCVFLSGICALGGNTQMAPPASEISVIISSVLAASPPPPAVEEAGPGDSSSSSSESEAAAEEADSSDDEKKDEGDGDEAASPIAPPAPLISTRALDGDVNVVEPVSGAGNPALFGSAVNETTIGGGKP